MGIETSRSPEDDPSGSIEKSGGTSDRVVGKKLATQGDVDKLEGWVRKLSEEKLKSDRDEGAIRKYEEGLEVELRNFGLTREEMEKALSSSLSGLHNGGKEMPEGAARKLIVGFLEGKKIKVDESETQQ